ncbi:excinuclease ABC subunit B [Mycoplasmopsis maculosa]|uniref:UvrABC system protein B n=1 Tax=Mycoplasmopsis maculosa TaxID=114885 RepID=A0A449B3L9_9BACT|nr:excinuclease ABC subunit UvrB [Mycoplasmopsis maculosa]VEU75159.1 excinuclease ABC subunit B [Mycoplasmopsis maculosa]
MSIYKLVSNYNPSGDQPKAIKEIVNGIKNNEKYQVLKGVTGSGKTFTIANVIKEFDRPVLVLSHNKTLASQLYSELKAFFPENKVEYFVSYFDYYRPEAYIPESDSYIDKTSKTNIDLDAMRMSTVNSLLTRNDTIVVASVSAIYGALNPKEYLENFYEIEVGMTIKRNDFFKNLIRRNYTRNDTELVLGSFSSKGDLIYIRPAYDDSFIIRVEFFDDEIDGIKICHPVTKEVIENHKKIIIYPGDAYTVNVDIIKKTCELARIELRERIKYFEDNNKLLEAQRIKEKTERDIDSLEEFGVCSGIENYSMYLDERDFDQRPYTLLDYFMDKKPILFIDESHMMIPQLKAMFKGDNSRKKTLVDYGFRLPSALENRPLRFEEFEKEFDFQTIYISATPDEFELDKTHGVVTNLFVRPTGLLNPIIEVRKKENQVENIYDELQKQKEKNERTLILTTTKRFAEELTRYFLEKNEKIAYIHSEHSTFERNQILRKLRKGVYDCVIGINLLREGIDLPEVSLIIVLDADQESFFRSTRSLIQIAGRAARNENGKVIFYADKMSKSMQETIDQNTEIRKIQEEYNKINNIIPKTIIKPIPEPIQGSGIEGSIDFYFKNTTKKTSSGQPSREELIKNLRKQMEQASKELDYERAIELRDIILELQKEN